MERLLGYQELPPAVDWSARKRLSALAADLTDLGVSDAPLPEAAGLPALCGLGAVWGTLYVAEGATLGGRVLRRHVEARLGPVPLRFLDGHGDRTQPMWRDLAQLADQYVTTKHDRQLAQQTAMQAFAAFSTWCNAPKTATGLTSGSASRLRRRLWVSKSSYSRSTIIRCLQYSRN
jgi:heme oxygenase (biliverdin-IX-beta and delta-forming)